MGRAALVRFLQQQHEQQKRLENMCKTWQVNRKELRTALFHSRVYSAKKPGIVVNQFAFCVDVIQLY